MKERRRIKILVLLSGLFFVFSCKAMSWVPEHTNSRISPEYDLQQPLLVEYAGDDSFLPSAPPPPSYYQPPIMVPQPIQVSQSLDLWPCEQQYISARAPLVQKALRRFIDDSSAQYLPMVSLCCSGGGYRAMIATFGFLLGAQKSGLLDAITYIATLSGSTWCLGPLLERMARQNISLEQYKEILYDKVVGVKFWEFTIPQMQKIIDKLLAKLGYSWWKINSWLDVVKVFVEVIIPQLLSKDGTIQSIDLWGAFVIERLLGDYADSQTLTFNDIRNVLQPGVNFPFPLFSTIDADNYPYAFLEFSPFVAGSVFFPGFIPIPLFGSVFEGGWCTQSLDEESMGHFLGMFGSAYDFSFADVLAVLAESAHSAGWEKVVDWLNALLRDWKARVLPSYVNNFVYHMPGVFPLESQWARMKCSDGGMICNIPFLPVLRSNRYANVILVCGASSDATAPEFNELRQAKFYIEQQLRYAQLPPLDDPERISEHVFVFEDKNNLAVPTIIYFENPNGKSSLDFDYTDQEFNELYSTMMNMVIKSKDAIVQVIKRKGRAFGSLRRPIKKKKRRGCCCFPF